MERTCVRGSVVAVVLAMLLIPAVPANATWMAVHGNAVQLQDPSNYQGVMNYGWGLFAVVKPSTDAWVHVPVPSFGDIEIAARRIKIHFSVGADTTVTAIHVWNGPYKVKEFAGAWTGENNIKLNMGALFAFPEGLSISVLAETGSAAVGPSLHSMYIYSAGANFVAVP
jgi:hypothetical protein